MWWDCTLVWWTCIVLSSLWDLCVSCSKRYCAVLLWQWSTSCAVKAFCIGDRSRRKFLGEVFGDDISTDLFNCWKRPSLKYNSTWGAEKITAPVAWKEWQMNRKHLLIVRNRAECTILWCNWCRGSISRGCCLRFLCHTASRWIIWQNFLQARVKSKSNYLCSWRHLTLQDLKLWIRFGYK